MNPIDPGPPGRKVVFAEDQPQYIPLPARLIDDGRGVRARTRWQLTVEERRQIAVDPDADVILDLYTFGRALQPVHLEIATRPPEPEAASERSEE